MNDANCPELIGMAKHLLGHMVLNSNQKYYNQATSFTAFSRHADVIRKLREKMIMTLAAV